MPMMRKMYRRVVFIMRIVPNDKIEPRQKREVNRVFHACLCEVHNPGNLLKRMSDQLRRTRSWLVAASFTYQITGVIFTDTVILRSRVPR